MIIYKGGKGTKPAIEREIRELEEYKNSYSKYIDYIELMFNYNKNRKRIT